ncbi:MAG: (Fe-S)-binding protein [Chloroflexota bacterium]
MLLRGYRTEVFRAKCNPDFESLHCIAHLGEDIGQVIPYLNVVLGGTSLVREPPSVMFRHEGKLIAVHSCKIAINALRDAEEAEKILSWLQGVINETWENRAEIQPCCETSAKPQLVEILRRLPKTNCRVCGYLTCLVFAASVVEGGKGPEDCPQIDERNRESLRVYLDKFCL